MLPPRQPQNSYTPNNYPLTPELALPGQYTVGVKTLEVVHEKQLNTQDFTSQVDRPLTLEVWYPHNLKWLQHNRLAMKM
ncbi:hypothetical protein P4S73_27545 [Paraglaciecola sp. Hal342]